MPTDAPDPRPDPDAAPPDDAAADDEARHRSTAARLARYVVFTLGGLVGIVALAVLLFVLALQTDAGATRFLDYVLPRVNPYPNAEITFDDVDGTFLSSLQLTDVRLVQRDSLDADAAPDTLFRADTLAARYELLPLLNRTLHVKHVTLAGARVRARQQADSTWNLLAPFATDTTDTTQAFQVYVDEIRLRDADLTARFYAPERDSTLRVRGLNARVDDLAVADDVAVAADTLYGRFSPPGRTDHWVDVAAGGTLDAGRVHLSGVRLTSPTSDVYARGTLQLPDDDAPLRDLDLTLRADPLDVGDLQPFVTALNPEAQLYLDATAGGSTEQLELSLDGRLARGGTLQLSGTVAPGGGEAPVRYDLQGQVRAFDPTYLLAGADTTSARINADLQVDLAGTSAEALDGTARLEVFDTRYGTYRIARGTATADVADGLVRLDARTALRGATIAAEGTLRPFDAVPTYDLEGRVADLDLGRFTEGEGTTSDLTATFTVEGEGVSAETADLRARIAFAPSQINAYTIQDGVVQATLRDGRLGFDGRVQFPEGLVAADGSATFGDEIAYRVEQGRVQNLDVAALIGADTTASALNGTFSLQGRGTDPQQLTLTASGQLTDSYYGPYDLQRARLDVGLRDGRLRYDVQADLADGAVDLAGVARPFAPTPSFEIRRGRFESLDVSYFTQDTTQTSDLTGTITAQGRGTSLDDLVVDGRLQLDASTYNRQQIRSADVTFALDRGAFDLTADLVTPEGGVTVAGGGRLGQGAVSLSLREGSFRHLRLGELLNADLTTDLNGRLTVDGGLTLGDEGLVLQDATFEVVMELDRSTINQGVVEDGRVVVDADAGFVDASVRLALPDGRLEADVEGRFFDDVPTYDLAGRMRNVDLAAFAGADTLETEATMTFDVAGEGLDPRTMTLDAELQADSLLLPELRVRTLRADLALQNGLLRVDTLVVRSGAFDATGGGRVALYDTLAASDFRLTADVRSLAPVRPFIDVETLGLTDAQAEVRVRGRRGQLRFAGSVEANGIVYNTYRVGGLDAQVAGELGPERTLRVAEASGEVAYFSAPTLVVQDTRFEVDYDTTELAFDVELDVDERRDGRIAGRVDLRPDQQRVVLDELTLTLDDDRWELLTEATITYGDEYRVRNLLLYTGDQQIAVDGVVDLDGEQNLVVTIEQFRIGSVADLLQYGGLDGTLSGALDLTGPAYAPNADGDLQLELVSNDRDVGTLDLDLRYDSLRLALDAVLAHVDGSTLEVEGTVPMDLTLTEAPGDQGGLRVSSARPAGSEQVDLTVRADSFAIGWVEPFLPPETVSRVDGKLEAEMTIGGTLETPVLEGQAMLVDGVVGLPELGVTYRDVQADVAFADNRVLVQHVELDAGGGTLIGTGTINLPDLTLGEFDLEASADDFLAIDTREYRMVMDGDFVLQGTTQAPVLRGDVQVVSADFRLTDQAASTELATVRLSDDDLATLERRFGIRVSEADTSTFDFYQALTMNLDVEIERDTWLRSNANPELDIQFEGELDLSKQPSEDVQLFGAIEVIPERSRINQFGKRFGIASGTLTFNGEATNPRVDLTAEYDVRSRGNRTDEVTITLTVTGRLEQPEVELGSDPQMETTDIVSYIATGRPASQAFQLGGGGGQGLLRGAAIGQLANLVEGVASSELGLDVVEIRQDPFLGTTTLTAGKYLSSKFYAAVSQPLSLGTTTGTTQETVEATDTQVTLEYEFYEWLLVRLMRQGSVIRVNLFWEYSY